MKKQKQLFKVVTSTFLALCMTIAPLTGGMVNVMASSPGGSSGGGSSPVIAIIGDEGLEKVPAPIDPKSWKLQRDMTWDEWTPNPVIDWTKEYEEGNITTKVHRKAALILVDFPDRPFDVTLPKESNPFGNPKVDPVKTEDLAEYWRAFLNEPSELNNRTTINDYLLENTYGSWSMELDAFGPFTLPLFEFQYGLADGMNPSTDRPPGFTYESFGEAAVKLVKESGKVNLDDYGFVFLLHAGNDESGVWQEFGEMKWDKKEDVPYEFGPLAKMDQLIKLGFEVPQAAYDWAKQRNESGQNWATSRSNYGSPWTSWLSGTSIWSSAFPSGSVPGSIQSEDCGMATFAHEFGHIVTLPDNYGSPFAYQRDYTGPWDMMSRGCFSGPGGDHDRWKVPGIGGGSIPTHMMLRTKMLSLNNADPFTAVSDIVDIDYDALKDMTPVVAEVAARAVPIGEKYGVAGVNGIRIKNLADKQPQSSEWNSLRCVVPSPVPSSSNPLLIEHPLGNYNVLSGASVGSTAFNGMTVEVVDRVGYDSFANDHGVIISRTKTGARDTGHCFVIDAIPEDINVVDFVKPNGETRPFTHGHQMQLADAAFHAGTGEGVVNEWHDTYNNLKFYVLDKIITQNKYGDVLSYKLGVLRTDGKPVGGELEVVKGKLTPATAGRVAVQEFEITNTGDATDIVRVNVNGTLSYGFTLLNNLYAIGAGETITVPVYISVPEIVGYAAASFTLKELDVVNLTLMASSESNPAKTSEATSENIANNSTINKLIVKADKAIVNKNDYFDVNVSFTEKVASNTAILTFTFDSGKFDYRSLVPAPGVKELNTVVNGNTLKITVMVDDYNTLDYGFVRFSAKDDIDLTNKANEIVVNVSLVVKDGDKKTIEDASGSTVLFTGLPGDTDNDGKVDLIDLSNMIDYFGFDKNTTDWYSKYAAFDFNRNGKIDISDITEVAKLIK